MTMRLLWSVITAILLATVPKSTSTPIQTLDCATTSLAGNASAVYLLRDCPAVTIATIANSDVTLLVDNCTVLSAAFAPGDVFSNVHLTFTRSIVLTQLKCVGNWSSVANVTVVIDRSNVSYDSWACSGGAGHFVFFETSEATNITIVMMHSYFEMRNAINSQNIADTGFFRVYAFRIAIRVQLVNVTVLNSTVNLMYANITSSDAEITTVDSSATFVHIEAKESIAAMTHTIDISTVIHSSRFKIEAGSVAALISLDGVSVSYSKFEVSATAATMTCKGPIGTAASRAALLFDFGNAVTALTVMRAAHSQLTFASVAGTIASRAGRSAAVVRNTKCAVAIVVGMSVTIDVEDVVVAMTVKGGQFSFTYANVGAYLVEVRTMLQMETITIRRCSVSVEVDMFSCPYRRTIQIQKSNNSLLLDMRGLYLNFFAAHVSLQAPLGNTSLSVTDSNVSSAFPNMSHCHPIDTTATMGIFTFQAMFLTTCTTSSVIGVSARALSKRSLEMFIDLPFFLTPLFAGAAQEDDTVGMQLLFVQNATISALLPANDALAALSLNGLTLRCSKLIAPSPWHVRETTIVPRTDATVTVGPNLLPFVHFLNVTIGADVLFRLGPYATRILVPSVQAACADCGLVVASNGTSLRGSSWVFEGITVDVARGSRFSLFGAAAGGSVVLPSREDVTLQCVRWVGRRLVPFGDGEAMLDRECGGSVTPTTLVPPTPHRGKAPLVATIAVASVTFALLPSVATVVPGIQMVSQLSAMRRMCAVVAAGDGVPPPPLSDAASDPLQIAITSFGAELMYAGGSVVSSLVFWMVFIVVALVALVVRGRAEWLAMARVSSVAVALRLPGSLYAPTMLVVQPLVTASVVLVASSARSGGSAALGVVVLLMTVAPLSIVVARIWQGRKLSLLRWRLVKKERCKPLATNDIRVFRFGSSLASYMFEDRIEWGPHGGRESVEHFERYGSVTASFVGEREWFVGVEVLTAVAGGVLSGVALGLDPSVGCTAGVQDGVDLSQAALLCGVLLAVVVLRPYASRFGNVLSGVSLLLSALCLVLQVLAPDTSDGAVSAMTWAQVALGILPLLWLPVSFLVATSPLASPHFPMWSIDRHDGAGDKNVRRVRVPQQNGVQPASSLFRRMDVARGSVDWRAENLELIVQCICQLETKGVGVRGEGTEGGYNAGGET